jgi:ATP-dependent helicase HrpA
VNESSPETSLRLQFPEELPITEHVEEIRTLLLEHQVLVVAGETGSGKTTQLPKICLAAGLGVDRMIGHTQPRRLAARTVAQRIAEEMNVPLGAEVGYAVRFDDEVSELTRVKLITDGLLLTEIRRDKLLSRYDVIIVDEAHERSLNIDFLLGYLQGVLRRRPELKLIITSATIDVDAFSRHFHDAPVVEVSGRTYPVAVRYLDENLASEDLEQSLLNVLEDIETGPETRARDILMFLAGEREILEVSQFLRKSVGERIDVLPLYARLSSADQQRVFKPGKVRRIVLATNVAETSLTVPNIGFVIDPGFARISRYSFRSKLQRLPVEGISQASANQRAGRCGRIAPGVCYRLYTESDFLGRPEYTDPEIKRTNLASVVLQMRAFDLGDPTRFPFLDPPDPRMIRDAEKVLTELGALIDDRLTPIGAVMARLPIDPRLARMLIAANETRALSEVLIIASAMAVSDPRERPVDKQGSADRAHEKWLDSRSDFLGFLNLWKWFESERDSHTRSALRRLLSRNFLSNNRMREWRALHRQLLLAVRGLKLKLNQEPADYASLHRALLTGSLSLIGLHDERGDYLGSRNLRFRLFPGSALAQSRPKWVMAAEIVETSRIYARTVAQVEPKWIEESAPHLLQRRHSDPHWSLSRGEALVYENVTLYGLLLAERRRVSLKRINESEAHELFLIDGLVRGAVKKPPEFLAHNLVLMAEIRVEEDKGRRRDLLASDEEIAARYGALIPGNISSVRDLRRWLQKASADQSNRLFLTREDLCRTGDVRYPEEDFPSQLKIRDSTFNLKYRFAPGEPDDGISVEVPMGLLSAVVPQLLDWSVPGMLAGVCEQWLRSLPKQKRRRLTPIPDSVQAILPVLAQPSVYRQSRFEVSLARAIEHEFGVHIAAQDWHRERIEENWLLNVQVFDHQGVLVQQSRDVAQLQASFARELEDRMSGSLKEQHEEVGLTEFPAQPLVDSVVLGSPGQEVVAFPALVDDGDSVAVRHLLNQRDQLSENQGGYARLALLKLGQTGRYLKKQIGADKSLGVLFAPLGNAELFNDELLKASAWACFFNGRDLPGTPDEFSDLIRQHRGELAETLDRIQTSLRSILESRAQLIRELDASNSPAFGDTVADIRNQLAELVPPTVLSDTPADRLTEVPRYLEAARHRLANLQGKVTRDREQITLLEALGTRIQRLGEETGPHEPGWQKLRYSLEEVRVGLFAERLGVRGKASAKRLNRELETLERELGLL